MLLRGWFESVFCLAKSEFAGADALELRYGVVVVMFAAVLLFCGVGVRDNAAEEVRELLLVRENWRRG